MVNEHYIKPVTAAAGKMSWALMMHPDGLDSDLFITHAWQEGIFEFTEKVLASWPMRARHAWCCMLANPQNLDIGALIQSPSTSPFAIALRSSKHLLVVPNRHKSVYTRLWCGFEAYLAFELNKIIRTARPPIMRLVMFAWLRMCPTLLVGILVGVLFYLKDLRRGVVAHWSLVLLVFLATVISQNSGQRMSLLANHLGLLTSIALLIGWTPRPFNVFGELATQDIARTFMARSFYAAYFVLAEIDRLTLSAGVQEAKELQEQYEGSIHHAKCSELQDEVNIRSEIGDQVDEVDKVIQVLIKTGMTSPALRDAYLQGVNIEHVADAQLAIPILLLGPSLLLGCWKWGRFTYVWRYTDLPLPPWEVDAFLGWDLFFVDALSVLARVCFLILLCRRSIDERCFMLNAMAKMNIPFFSVMASSLVLGWSKAATYTLFLVFHLSFLAVLFFAALGIQGTLNLPGGQFFAQVILSRFLKCGHLPSERIWDEETSFASTSSDSD